MSGKTPRFHGHLTCLDSRITPSVASFHTATGVLSVDLRQDPSALAMDVRVTNNGRVAVTLNPPGPVGSTAVPISGAPAAPNRQKHLAMTIPDRKTATQTSPTSGPPTNRHPKSRHSTATTPNQRSGSEW